MRVIFIILTCALAGCVPDPVNQLVDGTVEYQTVDGGCVSVGVVEGSGPTLVLSLPYPLFDQSTWTPERVSWLQEKIDGMSREAVSLGVWPPEDR